MEVVEEAPEISISSAAAPDGEPEQREIVLADFVQAGVTSQNCGDHMGEQEVLGYLEVQQGDDQGGATIYAQGIEIDGQHLILTQGEEGNEIIVVVSDEQGDGTEQSIAHFSQCSVLNSNAVCTAEGSRGHPVIVRATQAVSNDNLESTSDDQSHIVVSSDNSSEYKCSVVVPSDQCVPESSKSDSGDVNSIWTLGRMSGAKLQEKDDGTEVLFIPSSSLSDPEIASRLLLAQNGGVSGNRNLIDLANAAQKFQSTTAIQSFAAQTEVECSDDSSSYTTDVRHHNQNMRGSSRIVVNEIENPSEATMVESTDEDTAEMYPTDGSRPGFVDRSLSNRELGTRQVDFGTSVIQVATSSAPVSEFSEVPNAKNMRSGNTTEDSADDDSRGEHLAEEAITEVCGKPYSASDDSVHSEVVYEDGHEFVAETNNEVVDGCELKEPNIHMCEQQTDQQISESAKSSGEWVEDKEYAENPNDFIVVDEFNTTAMRGARNRVSECYREPELSLTGMRQVPEESIEIESVTEGEVEGQNVGYDLQVSVDSVDYVESSSPEQEQCEEDDDVVVDLSCNRTITREVVVDKAEFIAQTHVQVSSGSPAYEETVSVVENYEEVDRSASPTDVMTGQVEVVDEVPMDDEEEEYAVESESLSDTADRIETLPVGNSRPTYPSTVHENEAEVSAVAYAHVIEHASTHEDIPENSEEIEEACITAEFEADETEMVEAEEMEEVVEAEEHETVEAEGHETVEAERHETVEAEEHEMIEGEEHETIEGEEHETIEGEEHEMIEAEEHEMIEAEEIGEAQETEIVEAEESQIKEIEEMEADCRDTVETEYIEEAVDAGHMQQAVYSEEVQETVDEVDTDVQMCRGADDAEEVECNVRTYDSPVTSRMNVQSPRETEYDSRESISQTMPSESRKTDELLHETEHSPIVDIEKYSGETIDEVIVDDSEDGIDNAPYTIEDGELDTESREELQQQAPINLTSNSDTCDMCVESLDSQVAEEGVLVVDEIIEESPDSCEIDEPEEERTWDNAESSHGSERSSRHEKTSFGYPEMGVPDSGESCDVVEEHKDEERNDEEIDICTDNNVDLVGHVNCQEDQTKALIGEPNQSPENEDNSTAPHTKDTEETSAAGDERVVGHLGDTDKETDVGTDGIGYADERNNEKSQTSSISRRSRRKAVQKKRNFNESPSDVSVDDVPNSDFSAANEFTKELADQDTGRETYLMENEMTDENTVDSTIEGKLQGVGKREETSTSAEVIQISDDQSHSDTEMIEHSEKSKSNELTVEIEGHREVDERKTRASTRSRRGARSKAAFAKDSVADIPGKAEPTPIALDVVAEESEAVTEAPFSDEKIPEPACNVSDQEPQTVTRSRRGARRKPTDKKSDIIDLTDADDVVSCPSESMDVTGRMKPAEVTLDGQKTSESESYINEEEQQNVVGARRGTRKKVMEKKSDSIEVLDMDSAISTDVGTAHVEAEVGHEKEDEKEVEVTAEVTRKMKAKVGKIQVVSKSRRTKKSKSEETEDMPDASVNKTNCPLADVVEESPESSEIVKANEEVIDGSKHSSRAKEVRAVTRSRRGLRTKTFESQESGLVLESNDEKDIAEDIATINQGIEFSNESLRKETMTEIASDETNKKKRRKVSVRDDEPEKAETVIKPRRGLRSRPGRARDTTTEPPISEVETESSVSNTEDLIAAEHVTGSTDKESVEDVVHIENRIEDEDEQHAPRSKRASKKKAALSKETSNATDPSTAHKELHVAEESMDTDVAVNTDIDDEVQIVAQSKRMLRKKARATKAVSNDSAKGVENSSDGNAVADLDDEPKESEPKKDTIEVESEDSLPAPRSKRTLRRKAGSVKEKDSETGVVAEKDETLSDKNTDVTSDELKEAQPCGEHSEVVVTARSRSKRVLRKKIEHIMEESSNDTNADETSTGASLAAHKNANKDILDTHSCEEVLEDIADDVVADKDVPEKASLRSKRTLRKKTKDIEESSNVLNPVEVISITGTKSTDVHPDVDKGMIETQSNGTDVSKNTADDLAKNAEVMEKAPTRSRRTLRKNTKAVQESTNDAIPGEVGEVHSSAETASVVDVHPDVDKEVEVTQSSEDVVKSTAGGVVNKGVIEKPSSKSRRTLRKKTKVVEDTTSDINPDEALVNADTPFIVDVNPDVGQDMVDTLFAEEDPKSTADDLVENKELSEKIPSRSRRILRKKTKPGEESRIIINSGEVAATSDSSSGFDIILNADKGVTDTQSSEDVMKTKDPVSVLPRSRRALRRRVASVENSASESTSSDVIEASEEMPTKIADETKKYESRYIQLAENMTENKEVETSSLPKRASRKKRGHAEENVSAFPSSELSSVDGGSKELSATDPQSNDMPETESSASEKNVENSVETIVVPTRSKRRLLRKKLEDKNETSNDSAAAEMLQPNAIETELVKDNVENKAEEEHFGSQPKRRRRANVEETTLVDVEPIIDEDVKETNSDGVVQIDEQNVHTSSRSKRALRNRNIQMKEPSVDSKFSSVATDEPTPLAFDNALKHNSDKASVAVAEDGSDSADEPSRKKSWSVTRSRQQKLDKKSAIVEDILTESEPQATENSISSAIQPELENNKVVQSKIIEQVSCDGEVEITKPEETEKLSEIEEGQTLETSPSQDSDNVELEKAPDSEEGTLNSAQNGETGKRSLPVKDSSRNEDISESSQENKMVVEIIEKVGVRSGRDISSEQSDTIAEVSRQIFDIESLVEVNNEGKTENSSTSTEGITTNQPAENLGLENHGSGSGTSTERGMKNDQEDVELNIETIIVPPKKTYARNSRKPNEPIPMKLGTVKVLSPSVSKINGSVAVSDDRVENADQQTTETSRHLSGGLDASVSTDGESHLFSVPPKKRSRGSEIPTTSENEDMSSPKPSGRSSKRKPESVSSSSHKLLKVGSEKSRSFGPSASSTPSYSNGSFNADSKSTTYDRSSEYTFQDDNDDLSQIDTSYSKSFSRSSSSRKLSSQKKPRGRPFGSRNQIKATDQNWKRMVETSPAKLKPEPSFLSRIKRRKMNRSLPTLPDSESASPYSRLYDVLARNTLQGASCYYNSPSLYNRDDIDVIGECFIIRRPPAQQPVRKEVVDNNIYTCDWCGFEARRVSNIVFHTKFCDAKDTQQEISNMSLREKMRGNPDAGVSASGNSKNAAKRSEPFEARGIQRKEISDKDDSQLSGCGFAENDVAWVDWKTTYWPVLICSIHEKERRASIFFIEFPNEKNQHQKVSFRKLRTFDDAEFNKKVLDSDGGEKKYGSSLVKAVQKAEEFVRKRKALDMDISPSQFFSGFQSDDPPSAKKIQTPSTKPSILESSTKSSILGNARSSILSSTKSSTLISSSSIFSSHKSGSSSTNLDDYKITDELGRTSFYPEKTTSSILGKDSNVLDKVPVDQILQYIRDGKIDDHVVGVYQKVIDSERHSKFFSDNIEDRTTLNEQPWFGPVDDLEDKKFLYDYCFGVFMKRCQYESTSFIFNYIHQVWCPEAIIKAISDIKKMPMGEAESLFMMSGIQVALNKMDNPRRTTI